MSAKAWRINPRDDDDYGQLSLGDFGNAGGGYFVVAVPTGMADDYAAHLMAASELMYEALKATLIEPEHWCSCPALQFATPGLALDHCTCWVKQAHDALAAATPPTAGGSDAAAD